MNRPETLSPQEIVRRDPKKVYELYDRWPAGAREALGSHVDLAEKNYARVVYLAVGGSATAGDIISDWFLSCGGVEVTVFRGSVPKMRLEGCLVIVCSTSGDTAETLAMAKELMPGHPQMVAISAGGKLKELADKEGIPHLLIGLNKAPRFTLPYSLFASIATLRTAGLLKGVDSEPEETVDQLRGTAEAININAPAETNVSKRVAMAAVSGEPCIYASSVTKSVAWRFKNSLNENAKMHATFAASPDFLHNEVEAWRIRDARFHPMILQRPGDPASETSSLEAFSRVLRQGGVEPTRVSSTGKGNLAQLMELCYSLDVASYYAGVLRGVEPFGIELIEDLKRAR